MKFPISGVLEIRRDADIEEAGRNEAELTYLKLEARAGDEAALVYGYPELVRTVHDLFLFSASYGAHLARLKDGQAAVSRKIAALMRQN